jgi:acetyl-CoA synthetase
MSKVTVHPVPVDFAANAHINRAQYDSLYQQSLAAPEKFWSEQAQNFLSWDTPWHTVNRYDFSKGEASWFDGGELNIAHNCIDRHLATRGEQTAIIWEGDDPSESKHISYRELHTAVCELANVLLDQGIRKGDRVCIYMPMIPEAAYAMLACARIGAIHSVVFGGFSPEALKDRIQNAECKMLITADEGLRGGKKVPLKANADKAMSQCPSIERCLVVKRTGGSINWDDSRDLWYHHAIEQVSAECPAVPMASETPLFILYTSGSTGKPKGVMHTSAGYLLQAAMTFKYVFDYKDGEVFWCTADVGWITGHSYMVYGPLANGATTLLFESVPNYPDASRCWQVIDKHQVNTFYTAPTALRALMGAGNQFVENTSRQSLRLLGTVGEPINPEAWEWYHRVVGEGRCPIVDTWWQTETGGQMLTSLPGAIDMKPGSATKPFFGIEPALLDNDGNEIDGPGDGLLVIKRSWPGQIRSIYGDHQRMIETYFSTHPGYYFTGDGARRDADGDYWITGRVDDVLNISGHRMGTAEIESALVLHKAVAEAAVVGYPHDLKGQGIYAYVTLMGGEQPSDELLKALVAMCSQEIGPIAKPDLIQWAPGLPKTRSGKIMRRILRKIAANELDSLGDTSTLADPSVVDQLINNRLNR